MLLLMLGMCGKKASMERQDSNGLIKNFKRECQSENVSKALRITVTTRKIMRIKLKEDIMSEAEYHTKNTNNKK